MKALILNSGIGKRMGELTANTCKCLVEVSEGLTVLDIQLKSLYDAGISEVCITTGPHAEKLENYARERYPDMEFCFVHNPLYDQTNYIYSIHLASEMLQDDLLLLHGDLVFEESVLKDTLSATHSVMVTDTTKPLPPKDFKAVVIDGKVRRVGIDEFGEGACYAQPMYKLLKDDWLIWLDEINRFCLDGKVNVYAENAFNVVSQNMNLLPLDIRGGICFEIDTMEDLAYGRKMVQQFWSPTQVMFEGAGSLSSLKSIIQETEPRKVFVVDGLNSKEIVAMLPSNTVFFREFTSNPDYEEIMEGISLFKGEDCDLILSIGGGSAIDVAKCINVLSLDDGGMLEYVRCKQVAIPTTAGTGSESTCFAVVYKDGEKQSIEHPGILPEYVILDSSLLKSLPIYHKKSTLLDALCQGIESMWAKGATAESKGYAREAIELILIHMDAYIGGNQESGLHVLRAANLSGKAINISKTTAAHAMSYKLSEKFGIAHGHAVALCLPYVWQHLIDEGFDLNEVSDVMGVASSEDALELFVRLRNKMDLTLAFEGMDLDVQELVESVNPQRLSNHPVVMTDEMLRGFYHDLVV